MNEKDKKIIADFKSRIPPEIRGSVKKIIVFGSRARGEEREDSDLDMAVLVEEKLPELEEKLDDIAYSVMWDHDFSPIISLKVFSEKRFADLLARGFSFYKHVQNEGVSI